MCLITIIKTGQFQTYKTFIHDSECSINSKCLLGVWFLRQVIHFAADLAGADLKNWLSVSRNIANALCNTSLPSSVESCCHLQRPTTASHRQQNTHSTPAGSLLLFWCYKKR